MSWKCKRYDCILLSKAEYINHLESHEREPSHAMPPLQPGDTLCVMCSTVCKSVAIIEETHASAQGTVIIPRSNQSYEDT